MTRSAEPPPPHPGEIIRYAYLWTHELDLGREEARKDRPCAVVLTLLDEKGDTLVFVLPVTSSRPARAGDGVEIPEATRRRLGLQPERCWVVVSETNRFIWPGPDLRPIEKPDGVFYSHGMLPGRLFRAIRDAVVARGRRGTLSVVPRTQ